ncbi:MAG: hypothetical protein R6U62_06610, partial [Bacteroidales bacterium]
QNQSPQKISGFTNAETKKMFRQTLGVRPLPLVEVFPLAIGKVTTRSLKICRWSQGKRPSAA